MDKTNEFALEIYRRICKACEKISLIEHNQTAPTIETEKYNERYHLVNNLKFK